MAKLNEVIKALAIKAGIKEDSPELIALLENDLAQYEVDDTVSGALNGQLISMDAAKKHPEIAKIYRTETLNTVDKKLSNVLDVLELDDAERSTFLGETNTYKRFDNLNELIKAAKAGKADANNPADKKAHNDAIAALNEELRKVKAEVEQERTTFQTTRKNDLKNFSLKGKIKNFKTILDGTNETAKFATCNTVVNSLLDEYKAELIADENGELKLQTKTGESVYNDKTNTPIDADAFLEMALSQNKLLKVSEAPAGGQENTGGHTTAPISGHDNATTQKDKTAKAVNDFNSRVLEMVNKQAK